MSSPRPARPIAATLLLAGALLGGIAACGATQPVSHEETPAVMDADVFVQLVVELRVAARDASDFDDFGIRRDSILARHGYDEADLEAFAEARGTEIEPMIAIWEAINQALREIEEREIEERRAAPSEAKEPEAKEPEAKEPEAEDSEAPNPEAEEPEAPSLEAEKPEAPSLEAEGREGADREMERIAR